MYYLLSCISLSKQLNTSLSCKKKQRYIPKGKTNEGDFFFLTRGHQYQLTDRRGGGVRAK